MSLATAIADHLGTLEVSQGRRTGEPFTVLPWQRRFVVGAFADGCQSAALSVARGNGKTALVAGIACAHLDGPAAVSRGEVVIVASSLDQARIAFEHILAFMGSKLEARFGGRRKWRVWDSRQSARIENRETGARVRCLGSDPRRAHGLAPTLILADEPAQWPATTADRMVAALRTAAGKQPHCRFVALGTRPDDSLHWFARLLDGGADFVSCHAAGDDDEEAGRIFHVRTWRKANPSFDHLPDLAEAIRAEAHDARRDPALLPGFKALRLNLGTSDVERSVLVTVETWARVESADIAREGERIFGIDLGTTASMSAVACAWSGTGRLEVLAALPSIPGLAERERRDGLPENRYRRMVDRAELALLGERVVPVPQLLELACERFGVPTVILCDRWREGELRDAMGEIGVEAPVIFRGQGFKDGAEDVRRFRSALLDGLLRPAPSLLLTAAMKEATVISDPAGNEKLAKSTQGGRRKRARDDAAAAAILAGSHLHKVRERAKARSQFWFDGMETEHA